MVFESGEGAAVLEKHDDRKIEAVVDDRATAGNRATNLIRADEAGGFSELFGGRGKSGAVFGVAGMLQPEIDGVLDLSAGGIGIRTEAQVLD